MVSMISSLRCLLIVAVFFGGKLGVAFAQRVEIDNNGTTASPTLAPSNTHAPTFLPLDNGGNQSIFDVISTQNGLLAEFVELAGLGPVLQDPTQSLTLLAPLDAAWEALHPQITDYMQANAAPFLQILLLGHVVTGESLSSSQLRAMSNLTVENGATRRVRIDTETDDLYIDFAKVVTADMAASNGVIHTLDGIANIPELEPYLSVNGPALLEILTTTGLLEALDGATLMAPSLFAFSALSTLAPDLADVILTDASFATHLTNLLLAHVVPDLVFSSTIQDGQNVTMANGDVFFFSVTSATNTSDDDSVVSLSPGLTISGTTRVVIADAVTVRTVVHHVDGLLMASFLDQKILDVAQEHASIFAALAVSAEMDDLLTNALFNITVFAPTNEAFEALNPATFGYLQDEAGKPTVQAILRYHMGWGVYSTTSLIANGNSTLIPTLYQDTLIRVSVSNDGNQTIVLNEEEVPLVDLDLLANHGILHTIGGVMSLPASTTTPAPNMDLPGPAPPAPTPPPQSKAVPVRRWSWLLAMVLFCC